MEVMWVGSKFPGDTNETLKGVQFKLYSEILTRVYGPPKDRYLNACRLLQIETDLAPVLRSMTFFDHRTLQDTHDRIASWYRFLHRDDGRQMLLGETDETYRSRLASAWRTFFDEEIASLNSDDQFTHSVLAATVFGNTDKGYAAEAELREILETRYQTMKRLATPVTAI